jgi:hypothetical protein
MWVEDCLFPACSLMKCDWSSMLCDVQCFICDLRSAIYHLPSIVSHPSDSIYQISSIIYYLSYILYRACEIRYQISDIQYYISSVVCHISDIMDRVSFDAVHHNIDKWKKRPEYHVNSRNHNENDITGHFEMNFCCLQSGNSVSIFIHTKSVQIHHLRSTWVWT